MLLEYWWKVFGRAVGEVYVCGPRCSDTKGLKRNVFGAPTNARYSICLIKLSAPLKLGNLNMQRFWRSGTILVTIRGRS